MALSAHFLDELRARTPLAAIIGRRVKLTRSGRNWKGCCPFHGEKTPSFYVYEDGFHCFGCGAHGDAISFVMQSQGAAFPEAVAQLAGEAGLEVPKPTPEAAAVERRRLDLHGVLDAVAAAYTRQLWAPDGARALAYLRGRGLADATIREFGLGWSGEGRGALAAALATDGITPALLVEAGVMRESEDGHAPYDLFFGRAMFPIRDAQGRIISFGGRIMGDGQPKYLNGPETELFSKRRTLFNLDRARAAVRTGQALVAVEGYMDVIALHQAGFTAAVAPLGTALTEAHLEAMWRLSPAPVLCFDGDAAGGRAARRSVELALPQLTPERSLHVARMPPGEDPDSLVRRQGAPAFQGVIRDAVARSLADSLYALMSEGVAVASPEQRAGFRARLEAAAALIQHPGLAREYRSALTGLFFAQSRRPPTPRDAGGRRDFRPALPRSVGAPRPVPAEASADADRARILLTLLIHHPQVLHDEEETVVRLVLPPDYEPLRSAMLGWLEGAQTLDSGALMDHLAQHALQADLAALAVAVTASSPACALPAAMPAEALAGFWHFVGLLRRNTLEDEIALARAAFAANADAGRQRRLIALCEARQRLVEAEPAVESLA